MSRARPVDNSATVSMFPFLAVLLCTMGALLVVLVGMTHTARGVALRETAARERPAVAEADPATRDRLDQVNQYLSKLAQVRAESERKLREEHQRLANLEAHMRQLREQFQKLQLAAAELATLEEEHYDDREQAEREAARLQQLISDTRKSIDSLKEEQASRKRSYALVPYEGPNGTSRRPIYVECRDGELVLQPEGTRISVDDLRPPVGPGNPLAAAIRAAREYLVKLHPADSIDRDTEPYPLVILRPSGAAMFGPAQRAIQSGDFDFGYELVEEDWELKYPAADPQLAAVEQEAVDQARIRQQALAAAAPRAYRHPALAAAGRFEFDDLGEGGVSFLESGGTGPGGEQVGSSFGGGNVGGGPGGGHNAAGMDGSGRPDGESEGGADESKHTDAASPETTAANGMAPGDRSQSDSRQANGATARSVAAGASPAQHGSATGNQSSRGAASGDAANASIDSANQEFDVNKPLTDLAATRGTNWAFNPKRPRAVAVRRTIQIVVRDDHIAVLSDDARLNARTPAGKTIVLKGDTVEAVDDFIKVVNEQIEGWGMAGDGLYWRPVLSLHVGPDGRRRAQDLARLLKNSGLELQPATAHSNQEGDTRATR